MNLPSSVGAVIGRIGRIESNFDVARPIDPLGTAPTGAFDPFGEVYQRAVESSRSGVSGEPGSATTTAVATRLPPGSVYATRLPQFFGATATGASPSAVGRIGGFGSMPVPSDLAGFGNGRVPADRLQPIHQSGHRLYGPAATAWDGLVAAAAAEGIELRITDSYRSYDQQVDLAARKGLYKNGGLAATPGTSNHGWGLAVDADVRDPAVLSWLRANGPRFGFVEAVPREPWHWEYRPHQV